MPNASSSTDDIELQEINSEEPVDYEATASTEIIINPAVSEEEKANSVSANESVRKITLLLSPSSRILIILSDVFLFKYVRAALVEMGDLANFELNTVAKTAIAPAAVFAVADLSAGLLLFDASSVAEKASKDFPDGFLAGFAASIKQMIHSGEFLKIATVISMTGIFPLFSFAGVAPIMESLKYYLGTYSIIPTIVLLGAGSCYYIFSQAEGNLLAVDYFTNKPTQRLCPEQKSIFHILRYGSAKDKLVAMQFGVEATSSGLNRMFFAGFIAYLAAVEAGFSDMGITITEGGAVVGSLLAYSFLRTRISREKYYGKGETAAQRYDLITQDDRQDVYHAIYQNMSWMDFIKKEILRALSPLGLSETVLAAYLAQSLTAYIPEITLLSGWPIDYALPAAFALVAGITTYLLLFRVADIYLELNAKAIAMPNVRERISTEIASARLNANLPALTTAENINANQMNGWNTTKIAAMLAGSAWTGRVLSNVPASMQLLGDYTHATKLAQVIIGLTTSIIPAISNYEFFKICIEKTLNTMVARRQEATAKQTPAPVSAVSQTANISRLFSIPSEPPATPNPEPAHSRLRCGIL